MKRKTTTTIKKTLSLGLWIQSILCSVPACLQCPSSDNFIVWAQRNKQQQNLYRKKIKGGGEYGGGEEKHWTGTQSEMTGYWWLCIYSQSLKIFSQLGSSGGNSVWLTGH